MNSENEEARTERGKGRVFRPKGRRVFMLAFYGPRADGTWGERRESAKTRDEAIARKRLERRIRETANHRDGIAEFEAPTQRRVTVGELFADLLADYESRQIKGLANARLRLAEDKPLRVAFGARLAAGVTMADVARYMNRRKKEGLNLRGEKGLANATVNREVELLRRAFRLGLASQRILRAPAFPKKLPEKNARQGFFETGDFRKILPFLPEPLDDIARFAFATGWRRGMLLGMTWEMVDRAGKLVTLPDSKNDDPQSVPLDDELAAIIERRWKAREYPTAAGSALSVYVFHRDGKPIPTSTFNVQFRKARESAKVQGIFHDFRRTSARNMIRGGTPESVAMRVTGHRSRSMFLRYDVTSQDDKLDALRRARTYAESRLEEGSNVATFEAK